MNIRLKYTGDATWYNPEDYVIGSMKVPFSTRELDYSINTRGTTMELSDNYDYEGNSIDDIEKIKIYDNVSYFFGLPSKKETIFRNHSKKISFESELNLLKTKKINYANLNSIITGSADIDLYQPSDSEGKKTVAVMWLIESMFSSVGLTNPNLPAGAGIDLGAKIAITNKSGTTSILFDELKTDLHMFYAINQPSAHNPTWTPGLTNWELENELTYFQFIDWFCQMFGVVFYGASDVNGTGYRMDMEEESGLGSADDRTTSKSETYFLNSEILSWRIQATPDGAFRTFYYDNNDSAISDVYNNEVSFAQSQTWWSNLMICIADRASPGDMKPIFTWYITPDDPTYYDTNVGDKLRNIKGGNYLVTARTINYASFPTRANIYKFTYDLKSRLLEIEEQII